MKTTQLKDALANNSRLIEDIVGIPSNFKTSKISMDNIFIMYHRNSDNNPLMINPLDWSNYQNSGEIADGVVVVEGGKILVVGPTETNLYWSSRAINGGGKTTDDLLIALNDWEGRSNTTSQITHSECNGASYASGFCAQYSRVNANGIGLPAGKWWLPSLGELMMICANMRKINYALSLINDAIKLSEAWYWSSTEVRAADAWSMHIGGGCEKIHPKNGNSFMVRPVSHILKMFDN